MVSALDEGVGGARKVKVSSLPFFVVFIIPAKLNVLEHDRYRDVV
jgi:hypothetical protein